MNIIESIKTNASLINLIITIIMWRWFVKIHREDQDEEEEDD